MEKAKATSAATETEVKDQNTEVAEAKTQEVSTYVEAPMGFEDEDPSDMIIPRIKVIQTLSPEKKEKIAEEGDIINSLTKERLNGRVFVPVFKFNNNIDWRDRADGGGIKCIARDGKIGVASDGQQLMCAQCKKCEFDNTKTGREAVPKCNKYINFFGFFADDRIPIILSFSRTNYNEGKKLFSLAKVTMQNMWHYGYALTEKLMVKGNNEWYNIVATPQGATGDADRAFAHELYKSFRNSMTTLNFDMDESGSDTTASAPADVSGTEF